MAEEPENPTGLNDYDRVIASLIIMPDKRVRADTGRTLSLFSWTANCYNPAG